MSDLLIYASRRDKPSARSLFADSLWSCSRNAVTLSQLSRCTGRAMTDSLPHEYSLSDVFTPKGIPTVTYVDRSESKGFEPLQEALLMGGLINLYGDSKIGKTVACARMAQQLLGNVLPIVLHGRLLKTEDDFWTTLGYRLEVAPEQITETYRGKTDAHADEVMARLNIGVARFGGESRSRAETTDAQRDAKFFRATPQDVVDRWAAQRRTVIVDDFHDVPNELQFSIAYLSKAAIDSGARLVVISIPEQSTLITQQMSSRGEAVARHTPCRSPLWEIEHIREIATKGFAALNVEFSEDVIDTLVFASYRCPMLMQMFCMALCCKEKILQTQLPRKNLSHVDKERATAIVTDVAETYEHDFADYIRLYQDDSKMWELQNGQRVNTYVLSMLAMAGIAVNNQVSYSKLQQRAQALLASTSGPRVVDISNAVKQIASDIAKKKREKKDFDPELFADDRYAFIKHPFFKLYLQRYLKSKYIDFPIKR